MIRREIHQEVYKARDRRLDRTVAIKAAPIAARISEGPRRVPDARVKVEREYNAPFEGLEAW